ncbi:YbhB/YbcL family Raf kinase inhibitor-like protein [Haloferax sp. Atlit-6N]|uniref:YbhB/YbcL family Raf kinase inhibitor-like protein n=1 Tax=unclassified Haloferax TaxID=2625095 RepID=UPI000E27DE62|nr:MULTISPECIES: YbhB/YbcL family Raf kinase inhibitor-like protein [unclassified Haloferax]RDZ54393.1 YbhB/YbcL family Raf kinase inhibitor-like protein [Haloferax sp. Atlit-4N]REA05967.1 YbhB/YbcL family Raf kinase inhibitor-like protein [Haloferax sp. Atlit-6N]
MISSDSSERRRGLTLRSPAFDDGSPIPRTHGYATENESPPLRIGGVPPGTASLALVMDDPDAVKPAGKVWDHWLVWNIDPGTDAIEAGETPPDAVEGTNSYGETGYGGPNPPDGEHTYRFLLYALDTSLDLVAGATKADLKRAIAGHVTAETQLTGKYAP